MKYPTSIPCFSVADKKKSADFYQKAFGFEKGEHDSKEYVEMRFKDLVVMFSNEGVEGKDIFTPKHSGKRCPMILYIFCDDVDAFYKNALAHGAKSIDKPYDTSWGDRMCTLEDSDGYTWYFAQHTESCSCE